MAEIVVTEHNFEAEVLQSDCPVLVDFWATWCGPCRLLAPVLEELAAEYEGRVKVGKINVDDQPALADAYGIQSIPTLLLFQSGEVVNAAVGYQTKEQLKAFLAI